MASTPPTPTRDLCTQGSDNFITAVYAEGLRVGYRWYDSQVSRGVISGLHGQLWRCNNLKAPVLTGHVAPLSLWPRLVVLDVCVLRPARLRCRLAPPQRHSVDGRRQSRRKSSRPRSGAGECTSAPVKRRGCTGVGSCPGASLIRDPVFALQLYVAGAFPEDPPRALKAFFKTPVLVGGATLPVTFTLTADDLSWYDVTMVRKSEKTGGLCRMGEYAYISVPRLQSGFAPYAPGDYAISIGASSRDLRLFGTVRVGL